MKSRGEKVKKSLSILVVVLFLLTSISTVYANSINMDTIFLNDNKQTVTNTETDKEISKHFLATDLLNSYEKIKTNPQGLNTVGKQFTEQYNHLKELIPRKQPVTIDGEDWDIIVPDDYPTIQEAVDSAGPENGYRIFVRAGTYKENVLIATDGIVLHGKNKDNTVVNGESKGDVISIDCNYLNISGFTIKNSGLDNSGIEIYQSSGNIIQDSIIQDNSFGITIHNHSHANNITGNSITDNAYDGIHVSNICTGNTVYDNTISDNVECGISIDNVSRGNIITWNDINNNKVGVNCSDISDGNTFHHNSLFDNDLNAYDSSDDYWDNGIAGNHWSDYTGIDSDGDGIGDTPYFTPGGDNQDNYPFMNIPTSEGHFYLDINEKHTSHQINEDNGPFESVISGGTIVVPDDYPTIQEAVDHAVDGDTIHVRSGTYYEHVIVDKQLKIEGEGADVTFVDGSGLDNHVFTSNADYVEITGFTIMNCSIGYSGVRVYGNFCNIYDSILNACGGGIEIWVTNNCRIQGNILICNIWGIFLADCNNCQICGNTIADNIYGMEIGTSSHNDIINNDIANNRLDGILQIESNNNKIQSNSLRFNNDNGQQIFSSHGNEIMHNTIHKNHLGVTFHQSNNNIIQNNDVYENTKNDIAFYFYSNGNVVEKNQIRSEDFSIGINSLFCNKNTIRNNNITSNTAACIHIISSDDFNIKENNIASTGFWSIEITQSSNISIVENKITERGLLLIFSNKITVMGNNIIESNNGIDILSTSNLIIRNNFFESGGITMIPPSNLLSFCSNSIENNSIKEKSIYYFKNNHTGGIIPSDAGQVILINCSNFVIQNLNITSVGGIQLAFSSNNTIKNNLISFTEITNLMANYFFGILLCESFNNAITQNTIINFYGGIVLWFSDNNSLEKNNIAKNDYGIAIRWCSSDNKISGNKITNNGMGILMEAILMEVSSNRNTIYQNNFIDNGEQAYFYNSFFNLWFSNYWDDWDSLLPRSIYGQIWTSRFDRYINWLNFDWHPAQKPYDIGG